MASVVRPFIKFRLGEGPLFPHILLLARGGVK